MQQPSLIIMAAGLGSRFGGLKQIEPVGDRGEIIMDYSLYDAWRAGFRKVVFVVKEENERDLRAIVEPHVAGRMEAVFAHQSLDDIPAGFAVPEGRVKPWGTAHAVRSCRNVIREPFAVINADDFYGPTAFQVLYDFLTSGSPETENAMVGYRLRNTVTENGSVARGICEEAGGYMTSITERTRVEKRGDGAAFTEDGEHWTSLPGDTLVSMDFWGFHEGMMEAFDARFAAFLRDDLLVVRLDGVEHELCGIFDLVLRGEHNVQNALAASALALEVGAEEAALVEALTSFQALEHRIEPCGELDGVRFINDSKATNTDSVEKALTAFEPGTVVLLLGGKDKGTDLTTLMEAAAKTCHAIVCFGAAGPRMEEAARAACGEDGPQVVSAAHLEEALDAGIELARPGDVVLLSPACASFDEFTSFEHRGRVFKRLVADRIAEAKGLR